ncbi:MAG: hydrogenase maturation nickel metallochaperone HypA [Myxococcota bacterium]
MHESALSKQILDAVLERTRAEAPSRIRRVLGWVAETETLSAQSLSFHFSAHARGTPAAEAVLELRLVHVEARCSGCAHVYRPEHHLLLCPRCGATEGELLGQTGLGVDAVEVE